MEFKKKLPNVSLNGKIALKFNFEKNMFLSKNVFYFFISEFGWFLIICLIVFLGFKYQYYHPPKTYISKNPKEPWNSYLYTKNIFTYD